MRPRAASRRHTIRCVAGTPLPVAATIGSGVASYGDARITAACDHEHLADHAPTQWTEESHMFRGLSTSAFVVPTYLSVVVWSTMAAGQESVSEDELSPDRTEIVFNPQALAMHWLAARQGDDGGWWFDPKDAPERCRFEDGGNWKPRTGATAVALMPFLPPVRHRVEGGTARSSPGGWSSSGNMANRQRSAAKTAGASTFAEKATTCFGTHWRPSCSATPMP